MIHETALIASLPMYNFPEIRSALDDFWSGLVVHLKREGVHDVPSRLTHGLPVNKLWNDPSLFFTQCCGYDVVNQYSSLLCPIAVPHFSASGCSGSEYSSLIVVRDDNTASDVLEMKDAIAVINGPESHSGMSALRHLVASRSERGKFFSAIKISGSHIDSIEYIKEGSADVAPIDCVTYALLERYRPQSVWGLRVLGRTFTAPAPPYVIRKIGTLNFKERLWTALAKSYEDPSLRSARQRLFLKDIEQVSSNYYDKIRAFEEHAIKLEYPVLG